MRAGIGVYARSITMVEVPAAHFVPEAANPETTRVGANVRYLPGQEERGYEDFAKFSPPSFEV